MNRRSTFTLAIAVLFLAVTVHASDSASKVDQRLQNAHDVLNEVLNMPEGIPSNLLEKSKCVIVMPSVKKAAFGVGGSYGRGVMVCRTGSSMEGSWGAPVMYVLEGGSYGFQIGGESTDFVLLVMNQQGVQSLLQNKVKLGADISAAAGPVGRNAQAGTDASLQSEILTYSRSRGAFAGVSLNGASLRPDDEADQSLYGKKIGAKQIIMGPAPATPSAAQPLVSLLDKASPGKSA